MKGVGEGMKYEALSIQHFCVALSGLLGRGGSGFSFPQDLRPGLPCFALAGLADWEFVSGGLRPRVNSGGPLGL